MKYKFEKPIIGKIGTAKYGCTLEWRNGVMISDEPEDLGGKELGPDPYTLLIASVASCALVTMRMYIDRKGWDIPFIRINVNLYQDMLNDRPTTVIDRDIIFPDSLTEEQKIKLKEITSLCPISKILEADIKLRTFIFKTGETKTIRYGNEEISVLWRPEFCQHSTRCWKQLPKVFNPSIKHWINPDGSPPDRIHEQIKRCPSGALGFVYNKEKTE